MRGGDVQRGEATGAPAHQRDPAGRGPAFLHRVPDRRRRRRRHRARPTDRRARSGTRRRSPTSRGSSAAAPRSPAARATARADSSRRAPARSGRRAPARPAAPDPERRGARHSSPCTAALPDFHITGRGSTSPVRSKPPTGPRAIDRRAEPFAASTTTCAGVTAPERTHTMPSSPHERSRCQPRDNSRADLRPGAPITSRPNPDSLRHHDELAAVGRPRERTLPRRPRRLRAFLVRLAGQQRFAVDDELGVADPREPRAVGREARLTARAVGCEPRTPWRRARRRRAHDPRRVPRHVRQIPLLPHERAAVGRPRRVPRVVGVRDPLGPTGTVERNRGDVAGVVALDRARDLAPHRHRRRERPAVVGEHPLDPAAGENHHQPAVGARHDEGVVVDPGVAAADPALGRHHDRRAASVGRGDHHVGAAVVGLDPGQQCRRTATSAGYSRSVTGSASKVRLRAPPSGDASAPGRAACLPGGPASILGASCRPPDLPFRARARPIAPPSPAIRCASPSSSTAAIRTAVDKASTAATSRASSPSSATP